MPDNEDVSDAQQTGRSDHIMGTDKTIEPNRTTAINQIAEPVQEADFDRIAESGRKTKSDQTTEPDKKIKSKYPGSGQKAGQKPGEVSSGSRRYGLFGVSAYPEKHGMDEDKHQSMSRWAGGVILFLTVVVLCLLLAAGSGSKGLTVTFDSLGGSEAAGQSVPFGGNVEEPPLVVRPGYTLKGWSITPDGSRPWDFDNDTVTETLTLYAVWETVLE